MTDELVIVVVANKTDLAARREVQEDKAREYVARVLGPETPLYEVSAKEDDGLCLVVREQEEEERITLNLGNLAYIYYQVLSRRYSFIWPGSWLTRSNTACHRTKRDRRRYKSKNHRRLPVPAVDFSKDLKGERYQVYILPHSSPIISFFFLPLPFFLTCMRRGFPHRCFHSMTTKKEERQ